MKSVPINRKASGVLHLQGAYSVGTPLPRGYSVRADLTRWSFWGIFLFLVLHIPLAFMIESSRAIGTLHALGVLALGMYWLMAKKDLLHVVAVTAYISGAELLWRGKGALVFWEYGKYAIAFLLLMALFRFRKVHASDKKALYYFILLLPSIAVMPAFDREMIAFNLTGPFCLAVATMLFSTVTFTREQLRTILLAILAPIVGFAWLASYYTFQLDPEVLGSATASIKETAAGVGPNQVSSALGFGALCAFLLVFLERKSVLLRMLFLCITLWLLSQAALTFSRGGVATAIAAVGMAAFYLIQNERTRLIFLVTVTVSLLLAYFFILPLLTDITRGSLEDRFANPSYTGRDLIARADIETYLEFPLFGVGPHQSKQFHATYFRYSSAHTEYTRMLAEHGTLGLLSLILLLNIAFRRFRLKAPSLSKAFCASFTIWALLFMLHSATRLSAASFAFGLAAGFLLPDDNIAQRR